MYRRILVTLDGSHVSEAVLPHALAHAQAFSAELLLLQVLPGPVLTLPIPTPMRDEDDEPEPENDAERAARLYLEAIAENLRAQGIAAACRVRRGAVVSTIVEEAARADLLLLATRGAGLLPRLMVGSIATEVVPLSPCPVLLIHAQPPRPPADAPIPSFQDAAERYGPLVQRPVGLRTIPVERIIGSVGRASELRADFMPRARPQGDHRYKRILAAMKKGTVMPPVDLYKLGYDYYVLDGHHRVAAARAIGQLEIDAVVMEFLPLDNADMQRVFLERRTFEQTTGLTRIGATRAGHYPRLLELIDRFAQAEGIADRKEAATRWYTHVYIPLTNQLRAARIASSFPGERTADLVVHVEDLRAAEEVRLERPVSWEEALQLLISRYRSSRRYARLRLPTLRNLLYRV